MAKRNWADGVLGNTPLSAKRLNNLESDLEASLVALARDPAQLFAGNVTYDANGAEISAVVKWPDGVDGTYSGTASVDFPGTVSAYTITRIGPSTKTYTQPRVTRDATTGKVTNRPPIVVTGDSVEEYLYPDPVAPSDLDAALVGKITDTGSDTRVALDATYGADATPLKSAFEPVPQGMDFVADAPNPLTRRVTAPLGSTSGTIAASALDRCQRTIINLPVPVTRWRIKIANWNILGNTALTTPISGTGIYYGTPAGVVTTGSTNRWNGDFTAAPTQAVGAFTVPTNGADYVSPWIEAPLAAKTPLLLSIGFTTTATGTGVSTGSGCQVAGLNVAGASGRAGDTVISGTSGYFAPTAGAYFDIRVEYEFTGTTPIGVFIGDSITEGTSDGDVFRVQQACLPHETWPGAAGMQGNYATINLGTASGQLSTFSSTSNRAWARVDLSTTVPDFAVVALGTNNIGAAYTANIASYVTLFQAIKALGIKRIFVSTLIPRTDGANLAGSLTADVTAGATSITSSISIASGTPIQLGWGRTLERVTTTGAPTGTGPYTIPVPALALAKKSGDQVISGMEMSRQGINDWLRQVPGDVLGCLDFDLAMAFGTGSSRPDPRTMSGDGVHPLRSGYQRMGTLAAPLGVTL